MCQISGSLFETLTDAKIPGKNGAEVAQNYKQFLSELKFKAVTYYLQNTQNTPKLGSYNLTTLSVPESVYITRKLFCLTKEH